MIVSLLTLGFLVATGPVRPGPYVAPWDEASFRGYQDSAAGISFEIPLSEFLLEAVHFDSALPIEKVKHLLTLSGPGGPQVTVDVWVDPSREGVWPFFEKYLAFMRGEQTSVASVVISRQRVQGILLLEPRSGQSYGHKVAVFAVGARVFRVTCLDKDDPRALKVFDHLVESFDAEVSR